MLDGCVVRPCRFTQTLRFFARRLVLVATLGELAKHLSLFHFHLLHLGLKLATLLPQFSKLVRISLVAFICAGQLAVDFAHRGSCLGMQLFHVFILLGQLLANVSDISTCTHQLPFGFLNLLLSKRELSLQLISSCGVTQKRVCGA